MSSHSATDQRGISHPLLGIAGLAFVVLAVVLLGMMPDKVSALTTTITAITFGLPVLIVTTLWWGGWPFQSMSRGAGGWARFIFIIVATLVLTGIGQAVTGAFDFGWMFGTEGAFGIFPYGFVLAASIFIPMLQLTFVTGKAPFHTMSPVAGGIAALATSWALGLAQYFFLLHWIGGPGTPPAPPTVGNGAIYALDWPAVLLSIVVLQMVFFVLLKGWPFSAITNGVLRFIVVNIFTLGGGVLLFTGLIALGLTGNQISAIAGSVTAAVILMEILFDGWPFRGPDSAGTRVGKLIVMGLLTWGLYALLLTVGSIGYPEGPDAPPTELWVAGIGLNIIAAFAITHVAVFGRWPFPVAPAEAAEPAAAPNDAAHAPAEATPAEQ